MTPRPHRRGVERSPHGAYAKHGRIRVATFFVAAALRSGDCFNNSIYKIFVK